MTADAADYGWLEDDEPPGAWMSVASCFSFLRSVPPADVVASLSDIREVDLSTEPEPAEAFVALSHTAQVDVAVFDAGGGWTVVYQDNGYPQQFVEDLITVRRPDQAVVVFWNVNSLTEFSLWEDGEQVVSFDFPSDRLGREPDRLVADMRALGIPTEDDGEEAFLDYTYARMMALAERLTGVHLDAGFLGRRLLVARTGEFDDDDGSHDDEVVHVAPPRTPSREPSSGSRFESLAVEDIPLSARVPVAIWLARRACRERGLDMLGWVGAALDALEARRPLPPPFESTQAAMAGLDITSLYGADADRARFAVQTIFGAARTNPLHGTGDVLRDALRATADAGSLVADLRVEFGLG